MVKNKLFIFINVFGMAIGIGCCIVAYFNWQHDANFDAHHVNRDKIYRVSMMREFDGDTKLFSRSSFPLGEVVQQTIPDVSKSSRLSLSWSNFKRDDNLFYADLGYVDPEFFEMFSFDILSGKPADLKDKTKLFISDEMAMRLFGSIDVVGKTVTQVMGNDLKELQVAGVFKEQPSNSSFPRSSYVNFENLYDDDKDLKKDDWKAETTLFLKIDDPTRVNAIASQLQQYKENHNKVREDFQVKAYVLDPFVGMAHRDRATDTWSDTKESNPTPAVVAPIFMAVLLLLIACFNMTNTSIAISSRRLKEIGIRKVMGSMRKQLVVQFIGETMFICAIALLIGLVMGEVLIGAWNSLWDEMKITSHYTDNPAFVGFLVAILLFTGLVSGSYPALYISGFEPVSILKGKLKFGGTNWFTRVLLGLQYMFSFIGLVYAIAFYQNSLFQRDFDLGINQDGIIIAYVENGQEYDVFRNALHQNKDIVAL
jgi:cell division protein FtsX